MSITSESRGRPVTAAEAKKSVQRLINSHFNNDDQARVCIPRRLDDDDLIASDYVEESAAQIAALTAEVARLKELVEEADKSIQAKLNKHSETARIYKDLGLQACSDHERGVVFGLYLALRAIRPLAAAHAAAPQATEKG